MLNLSFRIRCIFFL